MFKYKRKRPSQRKHGVLERRHMAEQKSTVQSIERAADILEFLYRKRDFPAAPYIGFWGRSGSGDLFIRMKAIPNTGLG